MHISTLITHRCTGRCADIAHCDASGAVSRTIRQRGCSKHLRSSLLGAASDRYVSVADSAAGLPTRASNAIAAAAVLHGKTMSRSLTSLHRSIQRVSFSVDDERGDTRAVNGAIHSAIGRVNGATEMVDDVGDALDTRTCDTVCQQHSHPCACLCVNRCVGFEQVTRPLAARIPRGHASTVNLVLMLSWAACARLCRLSVC